MGGIPSPTTFVTSMVASILLLVAAVGGLTFWVSHSPPPPNLPFTAGTCSPSPQWTPVYLSDPTAAQPAGAGWNMWARSAIGTRVCGPGQLLLTLSPQAAGGDPAITVLLDGKQLMQHTVHMTELLRVQVPRAGFLQLAYLNDYYRADVRAVEIQQVRSNVLGCQRLVPTQGPTNPRNTYVPQSDLLVLLDPDPILYQMCGEGILSVRMRGMPAADALPAVEVLQSGHRLALWHAPVKPTVFEVPVQQGAVTLNMTNPYARQTADRNLMITRLDWRGTSP